MTKKTIITENKQLPVSFLAIDQYVQTNIVEPVERKIKDKSFIIWGENNDYPDYIEDLYQNVSTLHSIVDGLADYVCGSDINTQYAPFEEKVNRQGDTIQDIIKLVAKDLAKYNGFALNIIKNKLGGVAEINYLDFKKVRSNEDNTKFYYADDWAKSFGRVKYVELPRFDKEARDVSTVFYYKNDRNRVYPTPMYAAATVACEIEKQMNNYHLNNIYNAFNSQYIVNFNSGKPSDELKEAIEQEFYEKFTGPENAGRPMLSFNNNKENETTVTKIDTDYFIDKYNTLAARTQQEIFTAFRCTPMLFGIDQQKTGFNSNEYCGAFRLFNKTVIEPMQNIIRNSFDKIIGMKNSILISPFEINFDEAE